MRSRSRFTCALLLCCVADAAGVAQADGDAEDSRSPAVEHYERGREHYLAGRYREALTELRAALDLDPTSPNLVYNVARVNEDLGNLDDAVAYYQRYLALLPSSDVNERDKTEKTIRRLQGAKERLAQSQPQAELKDFGPAPEPALGRDDLLFWITAGAGVALAIGGGVTGVLALQRENEAGAFVVGTGGTLAERDALAAQADDFALASDVLFASSVGALTAATLLYFLRDPTTDDEPALALDLGATGARFRLRL